MGSCLGGLLGAEQVLAWRRAGVCSHGCPPALRPQKASCALGTWWCGTALPKAKVLTPSHRDTAGTSLSWQGQRGRARLRRNPEGWHTLPSAGLMSPRTRATSFCSYLQVERRWTFPCRKCQTSIRVPLPPCFGHRDLTSGGKQIKSHWLPAGDCVCVCMWSWQENVLYEFLPCLGAFAAPHSKICLLLSPPGITPSGLIAPV